MNLTVLVENYTLHKDLAGEYGLSLFLQDGAGNLLVDTGQGRSLYDNAAVLGVNLTDADHLVLSHGHFDHVGGASRFLTEKGPVPLWAHPDFLSQHTRLADGKGHFIGCHLNLDTVDFRPVTGLTQITENVWAVEVPQAHRDPIFLNRPAHLVAPGEDGWQLDPFQDDISLVVKGDNGLSVLLGCSHAGVVNILDEVARHFATNEFYTVIGGMHIGEHSNDFIDNIVKALMARFQVAKWRPCHCTGFKAAAALAAKAEDVSWAGAGTCLEL